MKRPTHPAEVLKEFIGDDKMMPLEKASKLIDCHEKTLERILNFNEDNDKNRGMSQEMGWKMAKAFGTSKEFWNDMQKSYDLWEEVQKGEIEPVMKFNKDDIEFVKLMKKVQSKHDEAPHPAAILQPLIGEDKKYSITEAGLIMGIPRKTLSDFLQFDSYKDDNVELSPKMAIKLGKAFNMQADEWMELQNNYDEKVQNMKEQVPEQLTRYIAQMQERELDIEPDDEINQFVKNKSKSPKPK